MKNSNRPVVPEAADTAIPKNAPDPASESLTFPPGWEEPDSLMNTPTHYDIIGDNVLW